MACAVVTTSLALSPHHHHVSRCLAMIGAQGRDAFYRGEIADAIVEEVQKRGGVLSRRYVVMVISNSLMRGR